MGASRAADVEAPRFFPFFCSPCPDWQDGCSRSRYESDKVVYERGRERDVFPVTPPQEQGVKSASGLLGPRWPTLGHIPSP